MSKKFKPNQWQGGDSDFEEEDSGAQDLEEYLEASERRLGECFSECQRLSKQLETLISLLAQHPGLSALFNSHKSQ